MKIRRNRWYARIGCRHACCTRKIGVPRGPNEVEELQLLAEVMGWKKGMCDVHTRSKAAEKEMAAA
jgi:hypothetical protein